jgi:hypothetical protein
MRAPVGIMRITEKVEAIDFSLVKTDQRMILGFSILLISMLFFIFIIFERWLMGFNAKK